MSRMLHNLMAKEMGHMGKFILKKQCSDIGIDPEEIMPPDLPKLAQAVEKAITVFTGPEKAQRVAKDIRNLK